MKKFIGVSSFLLLLSIVVFYSCKRDKTSTQSPMIAESVSAIRGEFDKHDFGKKLSTRFNDSLNINWKPDWERIKTKKVNDSIIFYYVPLVPRINSTADQSRKYEITTVGFEQFIIVKQKSVDELIFAKAQYVFDPGWGQNKRVTSKRSDPINYVDFTGKLLLDDLSGKISAINYFKGQPIKASGLQNGRIVCDMECYWTTWCERGPWIAVTYGRMGESCSSPDWGPDAMDCGGSIGTGGGWELQSSNTTNCVDIRDDVPPTPPDGTGGGTGTGNATSVSDITSKLITPCFNTVFSEVKSKTLQNTISKMLNKLFGSTDVINLDILEGKLDKGVDADTRSGGSSGGYRTVEVTLNTSELQNASKEYIAATILHEIIHGIFLIKEKNPLIDDHNEMGSYYISYMADAIREMYPTINTDDARALAWGGVQESYGWSQLVKNSTAAANGIIDTNKKFKNGTSGTKCK